VFGTHSPDAAIYLVYVRFGPGVNGIGSVIIERDTPGFTIGKPTPFMSGEQWSQLYFENCRIPAKNVLLGVGGFKKQISGFNVERLGNSSRALALGRYAFNLAREHALIRKQFGRPLCEFQGLQWKFADMALKLESAQMLLYRAASVTEGLPSPYHTAHREARLQPGGLRRGERGGAGHGRTRLQPGIARRILHASYPWLDDRRRLDGNPQEPDRRRRVRPSLRSTWTGCSCKLTRRNRRSGQALLAPRSIALVGASDDISKTSARPLQYLRRAGYEGAKSIRSIRVARRCKASRRGRRSPICPKLRTTPSS
jgi:hypothetical protein